MTRFLTMLGLALLATALCVAPAAADPVMVLHMDETSGTTAPNAVSAGTDGTLYNGGSVGNGPAWVTDAQRGQVLRFDGQEWQSTSAEMGAYLEAFGQKFGV